MEKVYLVGDCHTARILEHWNPETCPVDFRAWGKGGTYAWGIDLNKKTEENELSSGTEMSSLYVSDSKLQLNWADIKDDGLIQVWLGYVDIRQFLPIHKDADAVAKLLVDKFSRFYPKSKIQFIEPLPQFTEMLLKYEGISPSYTYEERQEQNKEFCDSLRKYAEQYGLERVITQDQIHVAIGNVEFTAEITPKDRPHPVDCLPVDLNGPIYDLFISEACKVLNVAIN